MNPVTQGDRAAAEAMKGGEAGAPAVPRPAAGDGVVPTPEDATDRGVAGGGVGGGAAGAPMTGAGLTGAGLTGAGLTGAGLTGAALRAEPGAEPLAFELPKVLSPSRAGDFLTCPLLFRFRVIDRLPERPSIDAARGTLVHSVLERLFDLPRGERTPEAATGLVAGAWEDLRARDEELGELFADAGEAADAEGGNGADRPRPTLAEWLDGARNLLRTYFSLEDPNRLEPANREMFVETTLGSGLRLRGFVDRLDVSPAGDLRIVDYKTGRAPGPAFEGKALFQMKFYALVLWRLRRRVPRRLQLIYLGSGDVVALDPEESDLRATERKIEAVWAAIERSATTGRWQANPGKLCGWCDHQAVCPAFGGTPPPMPTEPVTRSRRTVSARGTAEPTAPLPLGEVLGEDGPGIGTV